MFLNKLIKNKYNQNFFKNYCTINNKPLNGFKILDLSRVLAGPYATQIFGDLGAQVIKVENVGKGDDTRQYGPPFYVDEQGRKGSAYFSCANRNKKSIALDISTKEGQDIVYSLAKESDVFIENFKVGGLKKYSLDYETIKKINPSIIYCSITGFGQDGEYSKLPGYDFSVQAMGGLISITGDKENPYKCGVAIVDMMTGLYANIAIQAALHHREKSKDKKGQYIDVSLLDVQASFLANHGSSYLVTGETSERVGNSHPSISPYDSLKTKDGFMVVAIGNNTQFQSMSNVLGLPHLSTNPLFSTNPSRVLNRKQLLSILTNETLKFNTDDIVKLLGDSNVPCSPINSIDKVVNHKQIKHRNMIWNLPLNENNNSNNNNLNNTNNNNLNNNNNNNSNNNNLNNNKNIQNDKGEYIMNSINLIGNPIHFSETNIHTPSSIKSNIPPPFLGQHTDEILKNIGLNENQILNLKNNNIVQ
ncbi:hypothetical protein ACTFIW_009635 [Dictyostelium discoideum]